MLSLSDSHSHSCLWTRLGGVPRGRQPPHAACWHAIGAVPRSCLPPRLQLRGREPRPGARAGPRHTAPGEANLTASCLEHARLLRASMDGAQLGQVQAMDADFSEASLNGPPPSGVRSIKPKVLAIPKIWPKASKNDDYSQIWME